MKVLHLGKWKHIAAQSSEQTVTWSWTDSVLRYEDKTPVTVHFTYRFTCTLTTSELEQSALRKRSQSDKCFVNFSINKWLPFFMYRYINSLHHCFSNIFLSYVDIPLYVEIQCFSNKFHMNKAVHMNNVTNFLIWSLTKKLFTNLSIFSWFWHFCLKSFQNLNFQVIFWISFSVWSDILNPTVYICPERSLRWLQHNFAQIWQVSKLQLAEAALIRPPQTKKIARKWERAPSHRWN